MGIDCDVARAIDPRIEPFLSEDLDRTIGKTVMHKLNRNLFARIHPKALQQLVRRRGQIAIPVAYEQALLFQQLQPSPATRRS